MPGQARHDKITVYEAAEYSSCESAAGPEECDGNRACIGGGEGGYTCGQECLPSGLQCTPGNEPRISLSGNYYRLYNPIYSGGLENLINLQEDWREHTLRFLGTTSAPWTAEELHVGGEPKPWKKDYYNPGTRIFDFNEDLKSSPPPGTPGVFSVERGRWRESS